MSFLLQIFPFLMQLISHPLSYGEDVCHFSFTQQISMENLKKKRKNSNLLSYLKGRIWPIANKGN